MCASFLVLSVLHLPVLLSTFIFSSLSHLLRGNISKKCDEQTGNRAPQSEQGKAEWQKKRQRGEIERKWIVSPAECSIEMGVSYTKTWRQIKVHSFSEGESERASGSERERAREPKRIFGEWALSAHVVQKSSYTSKFQLGGEAFQCGVLLSLCAGSTRCMR